MIGKDVWIGMDATILPGTTIGDGAVIGAEAVVFPIAWTITRYDGVPGPVRPLNNAYSVRP